jgi:hypothetical protein
VNGTFVLVSLFRTCLLYSGVYGAHKYSCKPPLVEPLGPSQLCSINCTKSIIKSPSV